MEESTTESCPPSACGSCSSSSCSAAHKNPEETDREFAERQKLQSRLCKIKHRIAVLSGKGGVGKSTVAVNLATSLALAGKRVGLLDVDIHGPSVPTMLGLDAQNVRPGVCEDGMVPIELGNLKVMSIGFLLATQDDAVILRGPAKIGIIQQFLRDVVWGDLDFLIIDSPPGTGDEPLSVVQTIGNVQGAVIVTTPQRVASVDVRKSITFCRKLDVPVLGVVENMSGFVCPHCGEITNIFSTGGGRGISESMGVPFLGSIPIDATITGAGDAGTPFMDRYAASPTAQIMRDIIAPIAALDDAE